MRAIVEKVAVAIAKKGKELYAGKSFDFWLWLDRWRDSTSELVNAELMKELGLADLDREQLRFALELFRNLDPRILNILLTKLPSNPYLFHGDWQEMLWNEKDWVLLYRYGESIRKKVTIKAKGV